MATRQLSRISWILAAAWLGTGCISIVRPPAEPEILEVRQMEQLGGGELRIQGYAPGWVRAEATRAPNSAPFRVSVASGQVLRSVDNPRIDLLTLAGVVLPATKVPGEAVAMIPVALLKSRMDETEDFAKPTPVGAALAKGDYQLVEQPLLLELFQIAEYVSDPNRRWRPNLPDAIVAPQDFRHLNRGTIGANSRDFDRARWFFAERTPIQVAIWMRNWNLGKDDLERELVCYGPGLKPLTGSERDAALRNVAASAMELWTAMECDPRGSRLAVDYATEAANVVRNAPEAVMGQDFPGSATPLAPIPASETADPSALEANGLVVAGDYK